MLFGRRLWPFEDQMCIKCSLSLQFWFVAAVLSSVCEESVIHSHKSWSIFSALRIRDRLMLFFKSAKERSVDHLLRSPVVRALAHEVGHLCSTCFVSQGIQIILFCFAVISWRMCTFPTTFPFKVVTQRGVQNSEGKEEKSFP